MFTVRKERIEFIVKGSKVIGHLFIPEDGKVKKYPAVFIGGPMTSVKEQVTGVYAKSLAELGFITLTIDHRYFGESEGIPRQYEKFPDKLLDIKIALDFLKKKMLEYAENLNFEKAAEIRDKIKIKERKELGIKQNI